MPELFETDDPAVELVEPMSDSFPLDPFLHLPDCFDMVKLLPTWAGKSEIITICGKTLQYCYNDTTFQVSIYAFTDHQHLHLLIYLNLNLLTNNFV